MYHPVRGGSRGGADQFNWDDVKDDKYRENYLGHSLRAPVGRWQKGKDLTWYAKDPKAQGTEARAAARESELAAAKKAEEEAMLSALGFSVPAKPTHQPLSREEVTEALRRSDSKRDDFETDRVSGVGTNARGDFSSRGKRSHEGVQFVSPGPPRPHGDEGSPKKRKAGQGKEKKSKKHKKEKHKKRHKHRDHRSPS